MLAGVQIKAGTLGAMDYLARQPSVRLAPMPAPSTALPAIFTPRAWPSPRRLSGPFAYYRRYRLLNELGWPKTHAATVSAARCSCPRCYPQLLVV